MSSPSLPRKILLIDDEKLILLSLGEILRDAGYLVRTAESGDTGLKAFETDRPDLVITDIIMPDCDGLEVIMSIQEKAPDIHIIAISGGGNTLTTEDCINFARNLGVARAVQKPIKAGVLLEVIQELLGEVTT